MEDGVSILVLAWDSVRPELLHEEQLIRQLWADAIFGWPSFLDPNWQMAHKVEEEVSLGNTDDLVGNLNKQTEAFRGLEVQAAGDVAAEVLGPCARIHLKCLREKLSQKAARHEQKSHTSSESSGK
jgi:hypothetical protein